MTALPTPGPLTEWLSWLEPDVVQQFSDSGWAAQDWRDLDRWLLELAGPPAIDGDSTYRLRGWLRDPPIPFKSPITPAVFQQTIDQYGHGRAPFVLNAYAAGASPRFVTAFRERHPYGSAFGKPLIEAWEFAQRAGLSEAAATGWAMTGRLYVTPPPTIGAGHPLPAKQKDVQRMTRWTDKFGPTAYLWILAGFTLEDAVKAAANGGPVSAQQLRVMVALAGVALPEGV